jgi:hypothetical protein
MVGPMGDWHAIVVGGEEAAVRAFVERFARDRPSDDATAMIGADVGLERDSHADRLEPGRHAVLVPDALMVRFVDAVSGEAGAGLRLVEWRAIVGASFGVEAEATSRAAAAAIRDALRPFGDVRLAEHAEHEEEHARDGVRRYVFRARGRIEGSLPGVLELRRRLAGVEGITTTMLRLA